MPYIAISPTTKNQKSNANSGEFFKELEAARPPAARREPEKLRFADAEKRIRAEMGLDLRTPEDRQRDQIRQAVAAGVAGGPGRAASPEKRSTHNPERTLHAPQKEPRLSDFVSPKTARVWVPG